MNSLNLCRSMAASVWMPRLAACLGFNTIVFSLVACGTWCRGEDLMESAVKRMGDDLKFLSSDELEGRNVGSEGIARAGEFIAERYVELGLETKLFDGTPFQEFTIPGPVDMGPAEQNILSVAGEKLDATQPAFVLGENFNALTLGSSGKFDAAGVVFVGYGITADDLEYDDYAGMDVTGKVVIVLRKEPQQNDPLSRFDGTRNSQYAYFSSKEANAAVHNAAALILINDTATVEGSGDNLLPAAGAGAAITEHQVPTYFCSRSVIDPLVLAATGKSVAELEAVIDETGKPASLVLEDVTMSGEAAIESTNIPVRNVVGLLPGKGELAEEYVVLGAHYDHVGMGGEGSLAPGTIAIHNGADDNGSGTTALLEVARRLVTLDGDNRRSLVFIAFTAEEKGLLGSRHYVRNPRFPLEQTVAMLNMDMVGRLSQNMLTVYGLGTAEGFEELIDRLNTVDQLSLDKQDAGFGPSDHSSFYEVGIPVFHFFTGLHNEYHRPSDDFELIDLSGMARIATMVTGAAKEISLMAERPAPLQTNAMADVGRSRPRTAAPPARPLLGVQLDPAADNATVASVVEDGPAAKAGVLAGDIITQLADAKIEDITGLIEALGSRKADEVVTLTVERDGEKIEIEVQLGKG